jgi:hypothetical protein
MTKRFTRLVSPPQQTTSRSFYRALDSRTHSAKAISGPLVQLDFILAPVQLSLLSQMGGSAMDS